MRVLLDVAFLALGVWVIRRFCWMNIDQQRGEIDTSRVSERRRQQAEGERVLYLRAK